MRAGNFDVHAFLGERLVCALANKLELQPIIPDSSPVRQL